MADTNFLLIIDNEEADVRSLMCHFQQDPYPGGRTYSLTIRDKDIISAAKKQFGPGLQHPEQTKQSSFLSYLYPMIGMKCGRIEQRFWANTVNDLDLCEDVLVIKGICSPHIS
jgi:hypothetical protein